MRRLASCIILCCTVKPVAPRFIAHNEPDARECDVNLPCEFNRLVVTGGGGMP